MDFMLTIVSEKNSPTLSVKMDSDAATLFAIRLMDIFADEVKFENGLVVKGRTYQQKTPELIVKDKSKIKLALSMDDSKVCSISQILETVGISKTTLYRYIRTRRD